MTELSIILLFIPSMLMISAIPGMCMTLAFSLGLRYGIRKTIPMMLGELLGVSIITVSAILGVASFLLAYPNGFIFLKVGGSFYLFYVAYQMWRSSGDFKSTNVEVELSNTILFSQGLITALSNPKGWAFAVSLLPTFINKEAALLPQLTIMLVIILSCETIFMFIYATGGKKLSSFLTEDNHLVLLNRATACIVAGIGLWLLMSN